MGYNSIAISHLSLVYVFVPVSVTALNGGSYNPTSDAVQMAFMPQVTQVPQVSDWQAANWQSVPSNILEPYSVYCLVGPGGTIQLGIGTYVIYVKITDSPEIPVLIASYQLEVF
jgi:hypothetical protein